MITIRKHASSGVSALVGTQPANPNLPPMLSKLMRESVPIATPTAERKQIAIHDENLTAVMRRIYEQHKEGTYDTNDYSQRSCQRHRKYFLSIGIDLRKPFWPSATFRVSVPESLPKQRAKSVPNKKKMMKLQPAPEPTSATSEPTCRKSECASDALSRVHRTRAPLRRTAITAGLGALARRAR